MNPEAALPAIIWEQENGKPKNIRGADNYAHSFTGAWIVGPVLSPFRRASLSRTGQRAILRILCPLPRHFREERRSGSLGAENSSGGPDRAGCAQPTTICFARSDSGDHGRPERPSARVENYAGLGTNFLWGDYPDTLGQNASPRPRLASLKRVSSQEAGGGATAAEVQLPVYNLMQYIRSSQGK